MKSLVDWSLFLGVCVLLLAAAALLALEESLPGGRRRKRIRAGHFRV